MLRGCFALALIAVMAALLPEAAAADPTRELPKRFQGAPWSFASLSIGFPNRGRQLRAKRLKRNRQIAIKVGSETSSYGHPSLVLMLRRTAREIARVAPGSVLLVGDLSREQGGPLAGHRSHQTGRDADVGFYARDARGKSILLDRFVSFDGRGRATDQSGLVFDDWRNWLLVECWVHDARAGLSHVFVAQSLRRRLLEYARGRKDFAPYVDRAAALLKQPEHGEPHADHFHVRIACPKGQKEICREESTN
jgi:penicillin-insensitive murein endopeptidase